MMFKSGHAKRRKCPTTGKVRYLDRIAAQLALADIQRQDRTSRPKGEKRAYYCKACQGWHLTSRE